MYYEVPPLNKFYIVTVRAFLNNKYTFLISIQMKLVAAYLLLTVGGNTSPSAQDVKKLLSTVGIEADDSRLNKLIEEVNGKNVEELIAEGTEKLASVSSASAAAAPAAGGAAPAAAAEEAPKKV